MQRINKSVTAENSFTDWLQTNAGNRLAISISGTFSANVTVQRRLDGANARDIQTFTAPTEQSYICDAGEEVRVGVKTGGFTSGTVVVDVAVKS